MIFKTVTLSPFEEATLTALCVSGLEQTPRRAVIVCPGGGYRNVSEREAEPIAAQFLAAGYATFILRYTVGEGAQNWAPLKQIALAIRHVRENAATYNVDPNHVFTCGFSAGGHLAASAGVLWDSPVLDEIAKGAARDILRPTGMILCYPVITGVGPTHEGSFRRLTGKEEYTREDVVPYSLELHVKDTTPPAFLWHTASDGAVPVHNSIVFTAAMCEAGIPVETHIFPAGPHGLALCNEQTATQRESMIVPHAEQWVALAIHWLRDTFD